MTAVVRFDDGETRQVYDSDLETIDIEELCERVVKASLEKPRVYDGGWDERSAADAEDQYGDAVNGGHR